MSKVFLCCLPHHPQNIQKPIKFTSPCAWFQVITQNPTERVNYLLILLFFKSCICLYHGTCIVGISDQIQVPALLLACKYYQDKYQKMAYLCVLYFLQASKVIIIFDN